VSGKVRYWRSIETCSSVDIDRVDDIVGPFGSVCCIRSPELASRCEEQAAIGSKCQASEERCVGLIGIYARIPNGATPHHVRVG